ncbi:hypothetical protein V9K67_09680 [Paraflavisolibacter sp. H34]|uniref:hypothetical protein n=1 Tax=Huijunlia imazamoxiresistens TaxID=3127457 RepID=UPI003019E834
MENKRKWLIGISGLLAIAATAVVLLKNRHRHEEKPPRKAPQLDIENPGTQAEFLVAPGESEVG